MNNLAIKAVGITKRFPGVTANDNVSFELRVGEIHVLLGENGAGKTTLMNILAGLYSKDSGEIYVWGQKVEIKSPQDALKLGIYLVPQTPKLVRSMTVLENVVIGLKKAGIILPTRKVRDLVEGLTKSYHIIVDIDAPVYRLSASEQKRIELLKALIRHARILIFDELTTSLSPSEKADLLKFMRKFARSGGAIIFVTHKMHEVFEVGDRVTVMRNGRVVGTFDVSEVTPDKLTELMFGKSIKPESIPRLTKPGDVMFRIDNLWVDLDGYKCVRGVSLDLHSGEILGLAGVAGNGQKELVETIIGIRQPSKGKIYAKLNGKFVDITDKPTIWRLKSGISYIPEDRIRQGIIPDMTVMENVILGFRFSEDAISGLLINWSKIKAQVSEIIKKYEIATPSADVLAKYLSGGNIQKLIIAREFESKPTILIAFNPTLGLDASSTRYIWEMLIEMRNKGAAILLISEDLDEILSLSDRIAVISEGEIRGIFSREEARLDDIGRLMVRAK
ncbi:MAG: ABC transporter ATP-binding protein [Candidatus Korarchaeota archaeon]|nr:ABC transporter ATP-binding protein [Thermoproteota archaeon]MCR8463126.1 ABC transporter ATP-binding protein [Thermoproteota archaeon]MCR8471004.1 ABC transporter ATP-binding protein [Thermoproteota archaeon]MCR8472391.1 ABC transporter ATP-binding protein [Thermoproteota archaeon]MCR8473426.1 ABC transporter ATP-binding protein [Thermoproteota archaeon]